MANCRPITLAGKDYRFCPDNSPAAADRTQALLQARCVDELSGLPLRADIELSTTVSGLTPRANAGVVGLLANPARRFPGLRNAAVELNLTLAARRYLPLTLAGAIGPFNTGSGSPADYPAHFAALNFGSVALHREAICISGRCVAEQGGARVPLDSVDLSFSGVWHRFPAADEDPMTVVEPPLVLSVRQGLYAAHAVGTSIQGCELLTDVGADKVLLNTTAIGSNQLRLSNRVNLIVGSVLAIESTHAERGELVAIAAIEGGLAADDSATITLRHPLRQQHRVGVIAVRVTPQNFGGSNALTRAGIAGDQTLFLDALTDLDTAIAVIGAGANAEYHRVDLYRTTSDSDGYFRMPLLSRLAMVQIRGTHASALEDVELMFSPDYERSTSRLDLIFS